jgi:branched-chain amino acid transport system permease protein
MGNLAATFLGVTVMTVAIEFFRPIPEYRLLIIGLIMILVLLFRPQGLLGVSAFKD